MTNEYYLKVVRSEHYGEKQFNMIMYYNLLRQLEGTVIVNDGLSNEFLLVPCDTLGIIHGLTVTRDQMMEAMEIGNPDDAPAEFLNEIMEKMNEMLLEDWCCEEYDGPDKITNLIKAAYDEWRMDKEAETDACLNDDPDDGPDNHPDLNIAEDEEYDDNKYKTGNYDPHYFA